MRKASQKATERQKQRLAQMKTLGNDSLGGMLSASEIHMVLHGEEDKNNLLTMLQQVELSYPIDVAIKKASKARSLAQNRTQWQWFRDAEAQGDQKAWEYRAYCKLHFGVPILRRDSPEYRAKYDRIIRPMPYEQKLELMVEPFDFPVTSAMNIAQHGAFLDEVKKHLEGLGFQLTDPQMWDIPKK